ncbi:MAG: hypothetical protein RIS70_2248 [Planctomycetota bacterium]
MIRVSSIAIYTATFLGLLTLANPGLAAPTITAVSLRGLQIEAPTVLTIDGADLLPDPQVLTSLPLAKVAVLPGGTPNRIQLEITVAGTAAPGVYDLRLSNAKGISPPLVVGVDRLPQQAFAPQAPTLPVAMHGLLAGEQRLQTTFAGKKGDRVVADVEAQRLGSGLRPVLRLYDARGVQIAWSPPQPSIAQDARLELTLPSDGNYVLELHDVLYRSPNPAPFRLKIGDLHHADLVFPMGVARGTKASLKLLTSAPGNPTIEFDATASILGSDLPVQWTAERLLTGMQPRIAVSDFPEVLEAGNAGTTPQAVEQVPVGINGLLSAANEEDRYLLTVKPGSRLQFDVVARRAGSALDGVLSILGEQGNGLASNDDRPGTPDPGLDFTVPEGVTKVMVTLRDLHRRGGPQFLYRIVVRDLGSPDFQITLTTDRVHVPPGGSQVLPIDVQRAGYDGPIELSVDGLPADVQVDGKLVPAGLSKALLTLTAAGAPRAARVAIVGRSAEPARIRPGRTAESPVSRLQTWMRGDVGVAITEPGPLAVRWTSTETGLPLGGKLEVKLALDRPAGVPGTVRFKLLTNQPVPKKTVKQNNADVQVDDVDRTLRLEGTPTAPADAKEATLNLLVPADLPAQPWTAVIVAELLAADNNTVIASSSTAARAFAPR